MPPPTANPDQESQQLYNALNQANPFDEIVRQPRRVYRHHLIPPEKPSSGSIIVRPAVVSTLPADDFRFDPQAHGQHVSILTVENFVLPGGSILLTGPRAHNYGFIGLKFEWRQRGTNAIVQLGEYRCAEHPHHIVFDRLLSRGNPRHAPGADHAARISRSSTRTSPTSRVSTPSRTASRS